MEHCISTNDMLSSAILFEIFTCCGASGYETWPKKQRNILTCIRLVLRKRHINILLLCSHKTKLLSIITIQTHKQLIFINLFSYLFVIFFPFCSLSMSLFELTINFVIPGTYLWRPIFWPIFSLRQCPSTGLFPLEKLAVWRDA